MTISGVALLAICTLLGIFLGDWLGVVLGVDANIGGVGIAMILLLSGRLWLERHGHLSEELKLGVGFWAALYIPIVVAMAAQQNVVGAVKGGPLVMMTGFGVVALCFATVAVMSRLGETEETMDQIEERMRAAQDLPAPPARRVKILEPVT